MVSRQFAGNALPFHNGSRGGGCTAVAERCQALRKARDRLSEGTMTAELHDRV